MEFGWGAERDVRAAVSWLLDRPGVTRGIGLLGLSMGAEVALTTAALDPRVDAVVAEGASARTWADARRDPNAHPVSLANEWVIFALLEALAPEPRPAPLIEAVTRIEAPVLLITGAPANEASLGPVSADAAPGVVELWAVPDAPTSARSPGIRTSTGNACSPCSSARCCTDMRDAPPGRADVGSP